MLERCVVMVDMTKRPQLNQQAGHAAVQPAHAHEVRHGSLLEYDEWVVDMDAGSIKIRS